MISLFLLLINVFDHCNIVIVIERERLARQVIGDFLFLRLYICLGDQSIGPVVDSIIGSIIWHVKGVVYWWDWGLHMGILLR